MPGGEELLDVAQEAARRAGEAACEVAGRAGPLRHEEKSGAGDLVTEADHAAERAARAVLARRRPHDAVLGEEGGEQPGSGGVRWVVDPVDGTTNFVYGRDDWCVSVAAVAVDDGQVLAGVVHEPTTGRTTGARLGGGTHCNGVPVRVRDTPDLAHALVELGLGRGTQRARAGRLLHQLVPRARDVRRGGSAALALAQVATGRADASWGPGLQPWDLAAGVLLVTEAGGAVGDLGSRTGAVLLGSGQVLACHPRLFEAFRSLLVDVYDGA